MYTRFEPTQLNVKSAGTITNGAIFLSHGLASGSVCLFQSRFDDFFPSCMLVNLSLKISTAL